VGEGLTRGQAAALAASWFERAAHAALEVSADHAARALLRQALDLTAADLPLDRARRLERLADATAYVADMEEGATEYGQAIDIYRAVFEGAADDDTRTRAAARDGLARATASLGLVRIQQIRFKEAVALADDALRVIGEAEDLATGWLLYVRAWGTTAFAYQPSVRVDLERALPMAVGNGDRRLELEVRDQLDTLDAEDGSISREEVNARGVELATLAEELRIWPFAARAWRVAAQLMAEEDPGRSDGHLRRAADVAQAHALTEEQGWLDYARTEINLVSGHWETAVRSAVRAMDLADSNAYHRVQIRTLAAVTPIAFAWEDRALLGRAARWLDEHQAIFPHSPFGNVMHGAIDLRLETVGLKEPFALDVDELLPAWEETQLLASWHAAVETIVSTWIERGHLEPARRVVDRVIRARSHPVTSRLGRGSAGLVESWMLRAEGAAETRVGDVARTALEAFRGVGAPWWIAKAIRTLQRTGLASDQEIDEAASIERALRLPGPAVPAGDAVSGPAGT
jgi:tetratricopeptide (TPR) repeat protein